MLDRFCGSGTTIIAAQKTGRIVRAIEIDPIYCDTAVRRYEQFAKDDAILVATGETFAHVKAHRAETISSGPGSGRGAGTSDCAAFTTRSLIDDAIAPAPRRKSPWSLH